MSCVLLLLAAACRTSPGTPVEDPVIWTLPIACERPLDQGAFALDLAPSTFVPSVHRATWEGPGGQASMWAVSEQDYHPRDPHPGDEDFSAGDWKRIAARDLEDGAEGLPVALLYPGEWLLRVVTDDGRGTVVSDVTPFEVPEPPAVVTRGAVRTSKSGSGLGDGFLVAHQYAPAGRPEETLPVIFDAEGRVVWWMTADLEAGRVLRAVPTRDLRSLLILHDPPGDDDAIDLVGLDGESLVRTLALDATHDAVENGDGTLGFLSYSYSEPGAMPEFPGERVAADAIRTVPVGATDPAEVTTHYDFHEDYVEGPWKPCAHAEPGAFVPGAVEWTHGNSLIAAPGGDGWYFLGRFIDAVLHVSADGERLWQLGGRNATLTPTFTTPEFRHGHASHAWREPDGDHLLIFDNRTHDTVPVSRIVELRIDAEAGTYDQVWVLRDPKEQHTSFLGDARRLPNGNTLVDWTARGELTEHTPDGDVVWAFDTPVPLGRVWYSATLKP